MLAQNCTTAASDFQWNFVSVGNCCVQFVAPQDNQFSSVSWTSNDGSLNSNTPSSVNHCFPGTNTYSVTHTVELPSGEFCSTTKSISVSCPTCPQILGIQIQQSAAFFAGCIPTNLKNPDDDNQTELVGVCRFQLSCFLNEFNSANQYNWTIFNWSTITLANSIYCQTTSTLPNLNLQTLLPTFGSGGDMDYIIRLIVTSPNCSPVQRLARLHLPASNNSNTCDGFQVFGFKSHNEEVSALKQLKSSSSQTKIFPNPVDNLLHISNLKDSEDYTMEIHNTLGQTILSNA